MQGSTPVAKQYTRLWEITIVIALRDMQWKFRLPASHPEPYLPVSGGLERSGADALLKVNGRLFFFEIKADRSRIKEEWSKKRGKRKSKLAFRSARRAMLSYGRSSMPAHLPHTLHQSLQCHHFVYWVPTAKTGSKRAGHIVIDPYLLATIREKLGDHPKTWQASKAIRNAYQLGVTTHGNLAGDPSQTEFVLTNWAPLLMVGDQMAALIRAASNNHHYWSPLGLALPEFRQYLLTLFASQRRAHQKINAVVMSDDGEFFQHITDTSQLEAIFFPRPEIQPPVEKSSSTKDRRPAPLVVAATKDVDLRADPDPSLAARREPWFDTPGR